ncbi:MAG: hypothetical protein ACK4YP_17935, partial [Myxococcota bacterium]
MILALVSFSLAEPSAGAPVDCGVAEVWATTPAPLATDVPIDAVPGGLVRDGSCGGSIVGTLSIPATGETVVTGDFSVGDDGLVALDPGGDLLPNTTYAMTFEAGDGGASPTEVGFT